MALRDIVLTGSELMLVWGVVRSAPAMGPQSTLEDRERRRSLYYFIKREVDAHEGERLDGEYTLRLSNTRRRILTDMVDNPPAGRGWPLQQRCEVVEPILEKLGYWYRPDLPPDLEDDDEEEERDVMPPVRPDLDEEERERDISREARNLLGEDEEEVVI